MFKTISSANSIVFHLTSFQCKSIPEIHIFTFISNKLNIRPTNPFSLLSPICSSKTVICNILYFFSYRSPMQLIWHTQINPSIVPKLTFIGDKYLDKHSHTLWFSPCHLQEGLSAALWWCHTPPAHHSCRKWKQWHELNTCHASSWGRSVAAVVCARTWPTGPLYMCVSVWKRNYYACRR